MTHPLIDVLDNAVLAWGLVACGLAQLSKLLIELVVHRRWRPSVLVETGGMPSSHSALMTGTSAGIGWLHGFGDPLFALAAVVTFVILYDASGVRRAAGLTPGDTPAPADCRRRDVSNPSTAAPDAVVRDADPVQPVARAARPRLA